MRRWIAVALGFGFSFCAFAQEAAEVRDAGDPWLMWKWANFLLLVGGLGYLISKSAGTFFRTRTETIQKGIADATKLKQDAEARAAEIERRMAGIGQEIERLRATAKTEFASEGRRIEQETAQNLQRIEQQAEQEIAAAAKRAVDELKTYAATLALDLAERQVRSRMTPAIDRALVDSFVCDLGGHRNGSAPR